MKLNLLEDDFIRFYTSLHPNCVKFSPDKDYIVAALYEHDSNTNQRKGGLTLYNIESKEVKQTLETCGILDFCWLNSDHILAACSDGSMRAFSFDGSLLQETNKHIIDHIGILTYVDVDQTSALLSSTSATLFLCDVESNAVRSQLSGHEAEIWCCKIDKRNNVVVSGSDDSFAFIWDTSINSKPSVKLKHNQGVCSINLYQDDYLISTGSYDENLRIWDLRNPKLALMTRKIDGSGIWRHLWLEELSSRPLILDSSTLPCIIAAMYVGFAVIDQSGLFASRIFENCPSIAYGLDFYYDKEKKSSSLAICTFYDNSIYYKHIIT